MTKEELKQLSRNALADMLLEITQENEQLRSELETARAQLADPTITAREPGDLVQAARLITSILTDAQAEADRYLDNIRTRDAAQRSACITMEQDTRKACDRKKQEARAQVEALLKRLDTHLQKIDESCE